MPEVSFQIRWPDGQTMTCISPSRVVREFFSSGMSLRIEELVERSTEAMERASERVEAKYGFRCSSAMAQRDKILSRAKTFAPDETVEIVAVG